MLRVALTGGIATGKSYVRARVAARGVPTIDADAIVHALLDAGSDTAVEVARRFRGVVDGDGRVDRKALAAIVFGDAAARRDLEAIVHPGVYRRVAEWAAVQSDAGARWILADIPLLYESGRQSEFDLVVVAACAPDVQLQRVMQRDRCSKAAALARLAAQWPIDEKRRLATHVVDTGGTFAETDHQVDAVCGAIDRAAEPPDGRPTPTV
jgi:dephospho-CoA kinase